MTIKGINYITVRSFRTKHKNYLIKAGIKHQKSALFSGFMIVKFGLSHRYKDIVKDNAKCSASRPKIPGQKAKLTKFSYKS
jgi:hypothetical protein